MLSKMILEPVELTVGTSAHSEALQNNGGYIELKENYFSVKSGELVLPSHFPLNNESNIDALIAYLEANSTPKISKIDLINKWPKPDESLLIKLESAVIQYCKSRSLKRDEFTYTLNPQYNSPNSALRSRSEERVRDELKPSTSSIFSCCSCFFSVPVNSPHDQQRKTPRQECMEVRHK